MNKKRKLISEDHSYLDLIERDLQGFKPRLVKLKSKYEELEIKPFSNAVFQELIENGTSTTEGQFDKKLTAQLQKAGITSKVIQSNMIAGSKEVFTEFEIALEYAKDFIPSRSSMDSRDRLEITSISFENGNFVITEAEKEKLFDQIGRIYIETEDEFKFYESLQGFLDSYKDLTKTLKDLNYTALDKNVVDLPAKFFSFKDGEYSINPKSIKSTANFHSWKSSMEAQRREWNKRRNN